MQITGKLITYKGYTVDFRERQFAKIKMGVVVQTVNFDSELGLELLSELYLMIDVIRARLSREVK